MKLNVLGTATMFGAQAALKAMGMPQSKGYRPKEWTAPGSSQNNLNAITSGVGALLSGGGITGALTGAFAAMNFNDYVDANIDGIYFDAIFSTDTEHSLTITQHPVQTGANISDHAFINPVRLSMQIGVSDAMAYRAASYGTDGETKSIQAYRLLCKMQEQRTPMTIKTRLNSYKNMVIESISVTDDVTTLSAFKATVNFVQVLVVDVGTEKVSARDWTTGAEKSANEVQAVQEGESTISKIKGDGGYYNPDKGGKAA